MRFPKLVPNEVCKTAIRLVIESDDVDQDGAPVEESVIETDCNWQDSARMILTAEQKYVRITGTAYFNGDICPAVPVISSGYAEIFGERRQIVEGIKARNPDGTVNYTEVRFQ